VSQAGFLQVFADGFSLPFVGLCALLGVGFGVATHHPSAPSEQQPDDGDGSGSGPHAGPNGGDDGREDPRQLESASEVQAALERGEFQRARDAARAGGYAELHERAQLFLALTRLNRPGPFATGEDFARITVDGASLVGVPRIEGSEFYLVLVDGQEVEVGRSSAETREPVSREDALRSASNELRATRVAMGDGVSGLAIHRLAFLAYSAELKELGTSLLTEALKSEEGAILVDMFGEGDFAALHRARNRLAGLPAEPPPPVAPIQPDPVRPDPVRPDPRPQPAGDDLLDDPTWREADLAYRSGLELYRGSFEQSIRAATPAVRAALREFRRGQGLLNQLLDRHSDDQRLENRMIELNALIIDCTKRQGTD
jgi:hypothetical protein